MDTSVILDVLRGGAENARAAGAALRRAIDHGSVVACDVVWAEVRAALRDTPTFEHVMDVLEIRFDPLQADAAELAGRLWGDYHRGRRLQRSPRTRVLPDLLIGAHAMIRADALLTRDRGFAREVFEGLSIIEP